MNSKQLIKNRLLKSRNRVLNDNQNNTIQDKETRNKNNLLDF